VAATAIAFLLLWSLDAAFKALWVPAYRVGVFLFTAIAIWDVPYYSPHLTVFDRLMLNSILHGLYIAVAGLAAAWFLSLWVYGTGPLRSLAVCGMKLKREGTCSRD